MSNFHKNIENIKTFRSLLDVIILRVENGDKVDFDSISKLNDTINSYYKSCQEANKLKQVNDTSRKQVVDSFLSDILENKYKPKKKRKLFPSYSSYNKNIYAY